MHKPFHLKDLELSFSHKTCFSAFSATIHYGDRIAIIGRNGSGKSTLLNGLRGQNDCISGDILIPQDSVIGYVPQIVETSSPVSGAEALQAALTEALNKMPNVLLLDEPTNHLDKKNRQAMLTMLEHYRGTLIVVSHDIELLRNTVNLFWHIEDGKIEVFSGSYDDYLAEKQLKYNAIQQQLSFLKKEKNKTHQDLMREQKRAANSKRQGEKNIEKRKWPTIVSKAKALRAEETSGRKKTAIGKQKQDLLQQLSSLSMPEMIVPKFSLTAQSSDKTIITIQEGAIGYRREETILNHIHFSLRANARVAIQGNNGSGKSTLFKAILNDPNIIKSGEWTISSKVSMGYLDQHYSTLSLEKTAIEIIEERAPHWTLAEIRYHLQSFLFRKNEEVTTAVKWLSGGEKVRLALAQIAAGTPQLLLLDEITNNIDLEMRQHLISVLREYPAAMIVISHDDDFIQQIGVDEVYTIVDNTFCVLR